MSDLLIDDAIVITMDSERRILEHGSVLIRDGLIAEVSECEPGLAPDPSVQRIDAKRMALIPGLIDSHGHAGHALVKSLGAGQAEAWVEACLRIYAHGSNAAFWQAEARLAALERLKAGVTTAISLFGGGTDLMRNDSPDYALAYCSALGEIGVRGYLAMGPNRPPFPHQFTHTETNTTRSVSLEAQMRTVRDTAYAQRATANSRVQICLCAPVFGRPGSQTRDDARNAREIYARVMDLREELGVLYTQDGHRSGSIVFAAQLNALGPFALFSHSVDLTSEDMAAAASSGTVIVHNPSAIMSIHGRCPVPELLDMGVTVVLGSDAAAPDRGYDMFRHMAQCMHYHRRHFRDPNVLPAGKVLEMATIDAAKGLGRDAELGSIEVGKRADLVLVDLFKPHLVPVNMPVMRLAHFANAADVDTVIIDGEVVMQHRKVLRVDERAVLEDAQLQMDRTITENNLASLMELPRGFWRCSRVAPDTSG